MEIQFVRVEDDGYTYCFTRTLSRNNDQLIASLNAKLQAYLQSELPEKPAILPIVTVLQLEEFEAVSEEIYQQSVVFLGKQSRGDVNSKASSVLKCGMDDRLSPFVTVQGKEKGTIALETTRFGRCIYAAVSFGIPRQEQPDRRSFIDALTLALRASKQRFVRIRAKN